MLGAAVGAGLVVRVDVAQQILTGRHRYISSMLMHVIIVNINLLYLSLTNNASVLGFSRSL